MMRDAAVAKALPADADSERAVLGGILYGNVRAGELLDMLRPEDFASDANRRVFRAARRLSESGTRADILANWKRPAGLPIFPACSIRGMFLWTCQTPRTGFASCLPAAS
jgi:DnaB-like helicase N terminal domain